MKRVLSLGLVLFLVWLCWSGLALPWSDHFEPLLLWMGIASCVLVILISARMNVVDEEGAPVELTSWRLALYIPWLAWAIVKANIDVALRILNPSLPISPTVVDVHASQRSRIAQVIYANSITLTPGTVSILIDNSTITVHALSRSAADGLETGKMDRHVAGLEGSP